MLIKITVPLILSFLLLGCTPLTPQEKEEQRMKEAKEARIKATKSMMMVKCMMRYGAKNGAAYDMEQMQINIAAKSICRAELGFNK